mgnify:CR=1 FL=1
MKTLSRMLKKGSNNVLTFIGRHLQDPVASCLCHKYKAVDTLRVVLLDLVRKIEKKVG